MAIVNLEGDGLTISFRIAVSFNEADYRTSVVPSTTRRREKMSLLNDKNQIKAKRRNFQPVRTVSPNKTPRDLAPYQDANPTSKNSEEVVGTLWSLEYQIGGLATYFPIHESLTTKELKSMMSNGPLSGESLEAVLNDIDDRLVLADSNRNKYNRIEVATEYSWHQLTQNIAANEQIFENMEIWNQATTFNNSATAQIDDTEQYGVWDEVVQNGSQLDDAIGWQVLNLGVAQTPGPDGGKVECE